MRGLCCIVFIICVQTNVLSDTPHPYSISWIQADIGEKTIRLSIKTTAEDLLYFHTLPYDSMFQLTQEKLEHAAQAHANTLLAGIYITDQHKKLLSGKLVSSNFSSLKTKNTYSVMELLKYSLFYTIEFEITPSTEIIHFHQQLSDAGIPAVSFLSISKNGNSLAQNVELTKEKPFTMGIDAVSIGNAAESNFMISYITLTDTRVVHELTLPLPILKSFIAVNETNQDNILKSIYNFVNGNSTVEVNGIKFTPEVTAVDFQHGSEKIINDLSLVNIRVEYPLGALPKEVAISWNSFNWKLRWFKSIIDAFGEAEEHNFSRFQPTFKTIREAETVPLKRN